MTGSLCGGTLVSPAKLYRRSPTAKRIPTPMQIRSFCLLAGLGSSGISLTTGSKKIDLPTRNVRYNFASRCELGIPNREEKVWVEWD